MSAATYWFYMWKDELHYQWSLPCSKRNWRKTDVYFKRYMIMVSA